MLNEKINIFLFLRGKKKKLNKYYFFYLLNWKKNYIYGDIQNQSKQTQDHIPNIN
jgi:hypothetical protein